MAMTGLNKSHLKLFVLNDQAVQEFQAGNKNTKSGPAKMCNFANLSSEQASDYNAGFHL